MALARNDISVDDSAIVPFELEKKEEHFDIEYFMRSTDAGLNNVARKILSYACQRPQDLVEFQKVNKTFHEFINNEEEALLDKFGKVVLRVHEKFTSRITGAQKYLEDSYEVSIKVHHKADAPSNAPGDLITFLTPGNIKPEERPEPKYAVDFVVTIIGNMPGIQSTVNYIEAKHQLHAGDQSSFHLNQFQLVNTHVLKQLEEMASQYADSDSNSDSDSVPSLEDYDSDSSGASQPYSDFENDLEEIRKTFFGMFGRKAPPK